MYSFKYLLYCTQYGVIFNLNALTFLTYKHLTYPLDCLVNYLLNKDTDIQSIKTKFPSSFQHFKDDAIKSLRKGVFPPDYMDEDWENKLPDIKYFHSSLNNTEFSDDDFNYAKEIYKYF